MITCPNCGHQFAQLPKLRELVKMRLHVFLDSLEQFIRENGTNSITSRQLTELEADAAGGVGMQLWNMQTPRLYAQQFGVLAHEINRVDGSVRNSWLIDLDKAAELRKLIS